MAIDEIGQILENICSFFNSQPAAPAQQDASAAVSQASIFPPQEEKQATADYETQVQMAQEYASQVMQFGNETNGVNNQQNSKESENSKDNINTFWGFIKNIVSGNSQGKTKSSQNNNAELEQSNSENSQSSQEKSWWAKTFGINEDDSFFNKIGKVIETGITGVEDLIDGIETGVDNIIADIGKSISNVVSGVQNKVQSLIQGAKGVANDMAKTIDTILSWLPGYKFVSSVAYDMLTGKTSEKGLKNTLIDAGKIQLGIQDKTDGSSKTDKGLFSFLTKAALGTLSDNKTDEDKLKAQEEAKMKEAMQSGGDAAAKAALDTQKAASGKNISDLSKERDRIYDYPYSSNADKSRIDKELKEAVDKDLKLRGPAVKSEFNKDKTVLTRTYSDGTIAEFIKQSDGSWEVDAQSYDIKGKHAYYEKTITDYIEAYKKDGDKGLLEYYIQVKKASEEIGIDTISGTLNEMKKKADEDIEKKKDRKLSNYKSMREDYEAGRISESEYLAAEKDCQEYLKYVLDRKGDYSIISPSSNIQIRKYKNGETVQFIKNEKGEWVPDISAYKSPEEKSAQSTAQKSTDKTKTATGSVDKKVKTSGTSSSNTSSQSIKSGLSTTKTTTTYTNISYITSYSKSSYKQDSSKTNYNTTSNNNLNSYNQSKSNKTSTGASKSDIAKSRVGKGISAIKGKVSSKSQGDVGKIKEINPESIETEMNFDKTEIDIPNNENIGNIASSEAMLEGDIKDSSEMRASVENGSNELIDAAGKNVEQTTESYHDALNARSSEAAAEVQSQIEELGEYAQQARESAELCDKNISALKEGIWEKKGIISDLYTVGAVFENQIADLNNLLSSGNLDDSTKIEVKNQIKALEDIKNNIENQQNELKKDLLLSQSQLRTASAQKAEYLDSAKEYEKIKINAQIALERTIEETINNARYAMKKSESIYEQVRNSLMKQANERIADSKEELSKVQNDKEQLSKIITDGNDYIGSEDYKQTEEISQSEIHNNTTSKNNLSSINFSNDTEYINSQISKSENIYNETYKQASQTNSSIASNLSLNNFKMNLEAENIENLNSSIMRRQDIITSLTSHINSDSLELIGLGSVNKNFVEILNNDLSSLSIDEAEKILKTIEQNQEKIDVLNNEIKNNTQILNDEQKKIEEDSNKKEDSKKGYNNRSYSAQEEYSELNESILRKKKESDE